MRWKEAFGCGRWSIDAATGGRRSHGSESWPRACGRSHAVQPGLGFKSFVTATQTIAGYEVTAMIRKGQVTSASANDMDAQRDFIAGLFSAAG
jgi:hypothetical protein